MDALPPIAELSDLDLAAHLLDWSHVLRQENGDLPAEGWAQIDELLEELHHRVS